VECDERDSVLYAAAFNPVIGLELASILLGAAVDIVRAGCKAREAVAVPNTRIDGRVMGMKPGGFLCAADVEKNEGGRLERYEEEDEVDDVDDVADVGTG
jgi:hypothetical protein